MSTFFYKVMKMISLAAAMMFLVAAALELMLHGTMDLKVLTFTAAVVYCLIAVHMASTLCRDRQSVEPHYVRPADPPVMQYDGKVFDYFGQDPTAPDIG